MERPLGRDRSHCTFRVRVALWVRAPAVPVTGTVKVPGVAAKANRRSVELALPFAGGVTGFGRKNAKIPGGSPGMLSVVAELKPLELETVTPVKAKRPRGSITESGDTAILKSAPH